MSTELATRSSGSLVNLKGARAGGLTASEMVLFRATILHEEKHGVKPGTLVNKTTNEPITGLVTPLFAYNSYIEFNGQKAVFVSMDRLDPKVVEGLKWNDDAKDEKDKKPKITHVLNFVCSVDDDVEFPVVFGFKATSFKNGKNLLNTCLAKSKYEAIEGTPFLQFKNKKRYSIVSEKAGGTNGQRVYWLMNYSLVEKERADINPELQEKLSNLAIERARLISSVDQDFYSEVGDNSAQF